MFTTGMSFALGEEIEALRDIRAPLRQEQIAPLAAEIDRTNEFPRQLWPEMGALGLHGITVAEECGGAGMGYLAHCVAMEEISRASASVGLSYGAHSNLCVNQIARNGTRGTEAPIPAEADQRRACRRPGDVRAGIGLRRGVDEAAGREARRPLHAERQQDVDHERASTPTRWWSMPRPTLHAGPRGITAFLIERGIPASARPRSSTSSACGGPTPASWSSRIARCRSRTSSGRMGAGSTC